MEWSTYWLMKVFFSASLLPFAYHFRSQGLSFPPDVVFAVFGLGVLTAILLPYPLARPALLLIEVVRPIPRFWR